MNTCAMDGCNCPVSGGQKFCSDGCSHHEHAANGKCACNHAECGKGEAHHKP